MSMRFFKNFIHFAEIVFKKYITASENCTLFQILVHCNNFSIPNYFLLRAHTKKIMGSGQKPLESTK